ncbi:MAG: serine protease [Hyphomicrobiales bacterium]
MAEYIEQRALEQQEKSVRFMLEVIEKLSLESTKAETARPAQEMADKGRFQTKKNRVKLGLFSLRDLMVIADACAKQDELTDFRQNELIWNAVIRRLLKFGYVTEAMYDIKPEYQISSGFGLFRAILCVDNVVFGPEYMVNSRRKAVPAINVKLPSGDSHCGTGLLVQYSSKSIMQKAILTNRHVLQGNEIVDIIADGFVYVTSDKPRLCDFADLAVIPVEDRDMPISFTLAPKARLLSSVITVGYPLIPTAAEQYALCHKGEINGLIKDIHGQEFLAISNHVSPGNSGGPLLSEEGYCVGVVTQSGVGDFGSGDGTMGTYRSTYHMAISNDTIQRFLESLS